MVTSPVDSSTSGKENHPALAVTTNLDKPRTEKQKKAKGKESIVVPLPTDQAFDKLLDDLQIPRPLRTKLATMEPSVKAAFIKSSHTLSKGTTPIITPISPPGLRRSHSSQSISSLASPRPSRLQLGNESDVDMLRSPRSADQSPTDSRGRTFVPPFAFASSSQTHGRGMSLDMPRAQPNASYADLTAIQRESGNVKHAKEKSGKCGPLSPMRYCSILTSMSSTQLDVETVKKLRLLLRNESASWTEDFVFKGGYSALLTRLNDILEVEWREEQHDDQVLHELLRCVKALSTSAVGCEALRSCCPTPFTQLISLLYSDKKPGDIGTRQLMIELIQILFELYPPSSLPSAGSPLLHTQSTVHISHNHARQTPWHNTVTGGTLPQPSSLITLPAPHSTVFSLIRALLLIPAPPPSEDPHIPVSPHAFIEELHIPRIYKTYLQELNDICRDYFWVFCHPNNTIWDLNETDEGKVEKPRAPGGMTGGVEFEAMAYMTTHFKLLNSIAKAAQDLNVSKEHELSAHRLHSDLFLSGIDRILLLASSVQIARKASTTYYPTLHLEIARYIAAASRAGYELPWTVSRFIGPPPSAMCKPGCGSRATSRAQGQAGTPSAPSSPRKRAPGTGTSPQLPTPRKVTPMFS
ncbi:hypothetical protein PHLCEN_2v1379 [Hermanssonia centrifuga]|uniref:Formin GTPase-binding domain-containing protein n=1 Tax=Hermanssonia centrifuga TaxID=98765 RepID=A0A2R6S398_9APHY|nr:hypothetical protein PHLCEN_2v1379 [Hermanssonia centrifuga]